jgi:hypothetical protein
LAVEHDRRKLTQSCANFACLRARFTPEVDATWNHRALGLAGRAKAGGAQSGKVWCAVAVIVFGLAASPSMAAGPEDGRRAYDAGHYADAMGVWAELSRRGNPDAQFGLGLLYDLGNGTQEDPETAFFWYKAAADAGLAAAEFNVAAMYDAGRGVTRSATDAALWYARAASHGHHRAQFDLGLLYQQGEGVPRNTAAAAAWMRAAADGGITAAAARLKSLAKAIPDRPAGNLVAVTLVSPAKDATLGLPVGGPAVELVWNAPPQPRPVRYEVQVRELGSTLKTVFITSVNETATLVPLPEIPDFYVWSVDSISPDGSRQPSDWSWFSVGAPGAPTAPSTEQSLAAVPPEISATH